MTLLASADFSASLVTACALAIACAVLSVPVIVRRWAFIGEGIGHSGFGGAGTAWMLAILFPALDNEWAPYVAVVVFCICTALAIGWFSHRERVNADAAIGIFLVASLAWGFLAQQLYMHHYHGRSPAWFDTFLFGQVRDLAGATAFAATLICLAVIVIVSLLAKELMAYSFDPTAAHTSGVRSGMIHYLLMLMIALVIIVGMRVAGSVLVTALLVLPGTIAMCVSRRFATVVGIAVTSSVIGAVAGLLINAHWRFMPVGPAIVLTLVLEFFIAFVIGRVQRAS